MKVLWCIMCVWLMMCVCCGCNWCLGVVWWCLVVVLLVLRLWWLCVSLVVM